MRHDAKIAKAQEKNRSLCAPLSHLSDFSGYILIYPALRNCFLSLWKWKLTSADERVFVGLENYIRILTNDSTFTTVIGFTFRFAFISLAVEMVLGLLMRCC